MQPMHSPNPGFGAPAPPPFGPPQQQQLQHLLQRQQRGETLSAEETQQLLSLMQMQQMQQQQMQQPGLCDSCCPQQPGQPGMCGACCQQQPGQPGMMSCLCPDDPNTHCCDTSANPTDAQGQPRMMACIWGVCDFTTWMVAFLALCTVVGFACVMAIDKPDDLLGEFGASDTAALACTLRTGNLTAVWNKSLSDCGCVLGTEKLLGVGSVCIDDVLSAPAMASQVSRFVLFRDTLYFIAMLLTLALLVVIFVVHMQRHPSTELPQATVDAAGNPVMQQPQGPFGGPPREFFGTPLYYSCRLVWGVVAVVVFLWCAAEMYQYWWAAALYDKHTAGQLHSFWRGFDKKHVASVACIFIYLCWPICLLGLQFAMWLLMLVPWCGVRMCCYPQLAQHPPTPDVPEDAWSCCVRTDQFVMECHQAKRCGFSQGQWDMLTGTRTPFFAMCEGMSLGTMVQPQQGAGQAGFFQQQAPPAGGMMGQSMHMQPSATEMHTPRSATGPTGGNSVRASGAFGGGFSQNLGSSWAGASPAGSMSAGPNPLTGDEQSRGRSKERRRSSVAGDLPDGGSTPRKDKKEKKDKRSASVRSSGSAWDDGESPSKSKKDKKKDKKEKDKKDKKKDKKEKKDK